MNDIELIDEIVRRAEEHQSKKQKEFAIAELEKIKEKISKLTRYYTTESGHINLVSDNAVYRIIDKEIAKLKGENN